MKKHKKTIDYPVWTGYGHSFEEYVGDSAVKQDTLSTFPHDQVIWSLLNIAKPHSFKLITCAGMDPISREDP